MTRPLTAEAIIYDIVGLADPHLSGDGSFVVSTWSKANHARSRLDTALVIHAVHAAGEMRRLDTGEGRCSSGRWSPDGETIAFVREIDNRFALCLLDLATGEISEVIHHAAPVTSLAWSPDGKRIAYNTQYDPDNPNELPRASDAPPRVKVVRSCDYKQDNRGFLGEVRQQVWIVDTATSQRTMLTFEPVDHLNLSWSPDGTRIATKVPNHNGMHSQLAIVAVDSGVITTIGEPGGAVGCWGWHPTGDRLLLAADTHQSWQFDLFLADASSGLLTRLTTDLPCQPDAGFPTVTPPSQPVWVNEHRALFHALHNGASGLWQVDTHTGSVEQISSGQTMNSGLSADSDARYFVQSSSSLENSGQIVMFDRETGLTTNLSQENDALFATRPMASWHQIEVERDGWSIDAWILQPPGFDAAKSYPVVLDIHGGPNSWYGFGFNAVQQSLASAGFVTVFANPRGSGSYGRTFTQAVIQDWGGEDYLDLMAVVDRVLEAPWADGQRVGVFGYSYGGYMASWMIGQTDRFKAAVIGAPVVDLVSFYGTADIGHTFGPLHLGGRPDEIAAEYRLRSPLTYLPAAKTPTLILHGETDDRVPIGQGEQLFQGLLDAGCPVEFVRYPQGSHVSVTRTGYPAHRLDLLQRTTEWFERHLV